MVVVECYVGIVCVEDVHDARVDLVRALRVHEYRLCDALVFVVVGALVDGIHVVLVFFLLWMFEWIVVDF